jgi:hypothetical protein
MSIDIDITILNTICLYSKQSIILNKLDGMSVIDGMLSVLCIVEYFFIFKKKCKKPNYKN